MDGAPTRAKAACVPSRRAASRRSEERLVTEAIGEHATSFEAETSQGRRFEFGKNWQRFLSVLNEERIQAPERALLTILGRERIEKKRFLDIGTGSGLLSLAAHPRARAE